MARKSTKSTPKRTTSQSGPVALRTTCRTKRSPKPAGPATSVKPEYRYVGQRVRTFISDRVADLVEHALAEQQRHNRPAWFDGSHLLTLSGKFEIQHGQWVWLHNLSLHGILNHFSESDLYCYNTACVEAWQKHQAEQQAKQAEQQRAEQAERERLQKERDQMATLSLQIDEWIKSHTPRGKKGYLKLAMNSGPRTKERNVPATFYGPLAIHRSESGSRWVVTHVPTGKATFKDFQTQRDAKAYLTLLTALKVDWNDENPVHSMHESDTIFVWHFYYHITNRSTLDTIQEIHNRLLNPTPDSTQKGS